MGIEESVSTQAGSVSNRFVLRGVFINEKQIGDLVDEFRDRGLVDFKGPEGTETSYVLRFETGFTMSLANLKNGETGILGTFRYIGQDMVNVEDNIEKIEKMTRDFYDSVRKANPVYKGA